MNQLTRLSFSALPVAIIVASGVIVLALFGVAAAGQLQDGRTAFQHGDYATAMRLLRPLADQGNAVAQSYLGDMYNFGEGCLRTTRRPSTGTAGPLPGEY